MRAGQDLTHNILRHWWTVTPNEMRRPESINKPLLTLSRALSDFFFFFLFLPHSWEGSCGILISPPGAKPAPWQWKHRVLTTGPPENSPLIVDFLSDSFLTDSCYLATGSHSACWRVIPIGWVTSVSAHHKESACLVTRISASYLSMKKKRNYCLIFYSLNCTSFKSLWTYFNFFTHIDKFFFLNGDD